VGDDDLERRAPRVRRLEGLPLQKGDAQSCEGARRRVGDLVHVGHRAHGEGPVFDEDRGVGTRLIVEGQLGYHAGRLDARARRHLLQSPHYEADRVALGGIGRVGQRDAKRVRPCGVEPRRDRPEDSEAAGHQPRAGDQHEGERHLDDHERAPGTMPAPPRRDPAAGLDEEEHDLRAEGTERGHDAHHERGQHGDPSCDRQDRAVERDAVEPRNGDPRRQGPERAETGQCQCEPESAADRRHQEPLGEELCDDHAVAGAEHAAHRQVVQALFRPDQKQIGDVRARDEQEKRTGAEHDPQRAPDSAHHHLAQRAHHGAHVGQPDGGGGEPPRERIGHMGKERLQVGGRRLGGDPRAEPGDAAEVEGRRLGSCRVDPDGEPQRRPLRREGEALGHDADHLVSNAVNHEEAADDAGIGGVPDLPEPLPEDGDRSAAEVLLLVQDPPPERGNAEHPEHARAGARGLDPFGPRPVARAAVAEVHGGVPVCAHGREDAVRAAVVEIGGVGLVHLTDALQHHGVREINQSGRLREGERAE